jgi:hypothetical protein
LFKENRVKGANTNCGNMSNLSERLKQSIEIVPGTMMRLRPGRTNFGDQARSGLPESQRKKGINILDSFI